MKRHFIQFPANRAPKIQSRRFALRDFVNNAYKSDGDGKGATADDADPEAAKAKLLGEIQNQFTAELNKRSFASKTEVDAAVAEKMKAFEGLDVEAIRSYKTDKESAAGQLKELKDAMEAQGLELRAMKDAQVAALPNRRTIATAIRAAIDKDKGAFERFRKGESRSFGTDSKGNSTITLEERAAATMTVGGSTGGSAFVPSVQVLPGLVDLARNQPFLEGYADTSNTSSSRIVWAEKFNPQGNAAFIGEGVVKPLISFEVRTIESYAKKVADKIKVSTEMLDDIDFIASEIEKELKYKVDMAVDASLLAGAGDGSNGATDLKGLESYIGGYALTTVTTSTPNDFDAIRAATAQVITMNFNPNIVFINPIDAANMDLTKDNQGRPLAVAYRDANGRIYRVLPVESNQVPIGFFLLGDMSRFKVRNYQPFAVSYGWVNDDFEKNLVTIIGERRLHAFVPANEVGAFVYDSFANVKTAIAV